MAVEGYPQVVHHPLAHQVREVRLPDTDEAGDDWQHDHQPGLEVEQAQVARPGQVVDDQLDEDGIDDADSGGDQDRNGDDGQPAAVGPEEAGDAAQRPAAAPGTALEVRLEATPVAAAHHVSLIERNAWAAARPTSAPASAARSRMRCWTASQSSNWLAWQRSAASATSR